MSPSPPSSSTAHLVLVADDEPSMLELVASHLKHHDNPRLDILEASDGEQAWQLARERLPDLVVLDVMMPGMSGWEVCRKIREDVALAHTGVVMLTGIGENLNQMTSPLYGADAYLDKPFDFADLDAKVKQALLARATLRGNVARPTVNGIAGPAKAAPKKAAPKKAAAKKAAAKTAAVPKKMATAPKRSAAAPKKKAAPSKKKAGVAKKVAPKKSAKKSAAPKRATPKKKIAKRAATKKPAARNSASKKKRR